MVCADIIERVLSCLFIKQGKIPGTITRFSYIELEKATNKFSSNNLIGHGGSSNVYRAQLKDGRVVAVKKLNMHEGGGSISESGFLSEVFSFQFPTLSNSKSKINNLIGFTYFIKKKSPFFNCGICQVLTEVFLSHLDLLFYLFLCRWI